MCHALARRGALLNDDFVLFLTPPSKVLLLVNLDNSRVTYDRFMNADILSV